MQYYSISDLEKLSGIKAHTIRMWEKRYKALIPKRSQGNVRYYDNEQLRKLLNVVSLSETGRKISELFAMQEADLNKLIQEQVVEAKLSASQHECYISPLIIAGTNYDEAAFEKTFSASLVRYGMRNTYINVIYPMLFRVGLIWGNDEINPSQEHFLSNLIKQKIHASIDGLSLPADDKKCWLLFLPQGETHEIGLLFGNYLIRSAGHKTIYLGSDVPMDSLKSSVNDNHLTDLFFFFIKNRPEEEAQEYLNKLHKLDIKASIHIAGNAKLINHLKLEKEMNWIQSVEELESLLH
jgi:MerR family transcriptional regulator, light-induced transcriptional regulator